MVIVNTNSTKTVVRFPIEFISKETDLTRKQVTAKILSDSQEHDIILVKTLRFVSMYSDEMH